MIPPEPANEFRITDIDGVVLARIELPFAAVLSRRLDQLLAAGLLNAATGIYSLEIVQDSQLVSKPFMRRYQDQCRFGQELEAKDGIRFNLHFAAYADAAKAWRYPDLTEHTEYLAHVIDLTLDQEMRKEARYLRSARAARDAIKEIVEGPDSDIDRIIRSVRSNSGQISNKLRKDFPFLDEPGVAQEIVGIVHTAFDGNDLEDDDSDRPKPG